MMRRLILLVGIAYALVLFGLLSLSGNIFALALPFVVFMSVAFFYGPEKPQVTVERRLSTDRASQGVPVEVELAITNEGPFLEHVLLSDVVPAMLELVEGQPQAVTSLVSGETVRLTYTVRGQRGCYHFPGVQLTATDSLGLFRQQVRVPTNEQLYILPPVLKLGQVAIRPHRTRPYSGLIPANRGGPGVEFFGLREAEPGDPLRWVAWKACARHTDAFYTKEFEQECVVDVNLILDCRQRSYLRWEDESFFVQAVLSTAALADSFLNDGNRVGLLLFGGILGAWTLPGYGRIQRERILRTLSEAGLAEYVDRLEYLPTKFFPPGSQIVLISPLLKEDLRMLIALRSYGYPVLVISPDAVAFEEKLLGQQPAALLATRIARLERELLLRKLRQAGILVVDWSVDRPFHEVVYTTLRRVRFGSRALRFRARR